jgi:rubredoxin
MKKNICRVCGLIYDKFYPWGEDGEVPSHDICDCCGTEFGYDDVSIESSKAKTFSLFHTEIR